MAYSPKPDKRNTSGGMTPNKAIRRPANQTIKKVMPMKRGKGK